MIPICPVSGWHSLKGFIRLLTHLSALTRTLGLAAQDGASLTPAFLSSLVKTQGVGVIGKHFFPPIVVNGMSAWLVCKPLIIIYTALLGTILWTSYAEASAVLQPHIGSHPTATAAIAGALAGGTQGAVRRLRHVCH